jgi:hypothetical protein
MENTQRLQHTQGPIQLLHQRDKHRFHLENLGPRTVNASLGLSSKIGSEHRIGWKAKGGTTTLLARFADPRWRPHTTFSLHAATQDGFGP